MSPNISFPSICDDLDCSITLTDVTDHTGCFVTGYFGDRSIESNYIETSVSEVRIRFVMAAPDFLQIGDSVYFNIDCGRAYTIDAD